MREQLHGYSPAELDRIIVRMFFEWPDEAFVARQLGLRETDIAASLERFATKVAVLANAHWASRVLAQINELARCCDHLAELEDPPHASVTLRARIAALRQAFVAATETPTSAAAVLSDAAARPTPTRRARRLEFPLAHTRAPELVGTE